MIVFGDTRYIFGIVEHKPLLKIPPEAIAWKARFRSNSFACVYIRYPGRIEQRYLVDCGDHFEVADWVIRENIRGTDIRGTNKQCMTINQEKC